MTAITFMSAPHFRWSFADAHCSRMRPGRPCDVLCQASPRGLVENANAIVDAWSLASLVARPCDLAEAGVLPRQEVSGKIFVQEFALDQ